MPPTTRHRALLAVILGLASALLAPSHASAGSYAYITDYSHTVTVLDLATDAVRGRIEVGSYLPRDVAVDRRGRRAFVANECGTINCDSYAPPALVSVIDTTSLSIVATVPVPGELDHVVANRAGTRLYVTTGYGRVAEVDVASASVVDEFEVRSGPLALSRNDARLYVGGDELRVIDLATKEVRAEGRVHYVEALALGRNEKRIFVASCGARPCSDENAGPIVVDVMDAATLEVLASIPIAGDFHPGGLTVDPSGRRLYLSGYGINPERSMVWAVDTKRAVVTAAIPVPTLAFDLALDPRARRLYVTAYFQGDAMTVIDTRTNAIVDGPSDTIFSFRLAVGPAPRERR